MSPPPRCAPPAICSADGCLWHANAVHSSPTCTIPTASLPCPPLAQRSPRKPTATGSPSVVLIRRSTKVLQSISPSLVSLIRCDATSHSASSQRPSTMTPPPCLGCTRSLVSARCSASCCSTTSMIGRASRGDRILPRLVASSSVPGHLLDNALAPPAPQSAPPISHGRFPKPPLYAGGIIPPRRHGWPDWRKNTGRAKPEPSWLLHGHGRSTPCSHARPLVMWTHAFGDEGEEPVSSRPHWTARGCT